MVENIYIGIHEVSETTLLLSKGLRELGFEVTNVVEDQSHSGINPYGQEGYRPHDGYFDGSSNFKYVKNTTKEFLTQATKHDVFIFNVGTSFYGRLAYKRMLQPLAYADLPCLKLLGKKVAVMSCGSDLRAYNLLLDDLEEAGLDSHVKYMREFVDEYDNIYDDVNKVKAEKIQKYADVVFARPNYAQNLTDYELFEMTIDPDELEFRNNERTVPKIMHAPSSTQKKGTKHVKEAIDKLRSEGYDFEFELVRNLPNREFRKKLTESDIIIDQVIFPGHGLLSVEAMATGNAVLGATVPEFNAHPEDVPILTTTPDTIYQNTRRLLENPAERNQLTEYGRKYVENHHHYRDFAKRVLDSLDIDY